MPLSPCLQNPLLLGKVRAELPATYPEHGVFSCAVSLIGAEGVSVDDALAGLTGVKTTIIANKKVQRRVARVRMRGRLVIMIVFPEK